MAMFIIIIITTRAGGSGSGSSVFLKAVSIFLYLQFLYQSEKNYQFSAYLRYWSYKL
jgi:hypothetical protein